MSGIPNSAIPDRTPARRVKRRSRSPALVRQAVGIVTLPAFVALGFTAITVSAVRNWLRPAPPDGPPVDEVPV